MSKTKQPSVNLKPQLMYAVPDEVDSYGYHALSRTRDSRGRGHPVACIPCDDPEKILDRAYQAFLGGPGATMKESVRDVLISAGVLPKRKGRK